MIQYKSCIHEITHEINMRFQSSVGLMPIGKTVQNNFAVLFKISVISVPDFSLLTRYEVEK